ncbi:MAG: bacillithiol biosynthesis cysteine-adding enzyme BshC [Firmicutes bacterium]|nr:bacillithiol biosynthesis cysteine-adding enzyme BshC [Bacillota bacterium]
MLKPIELETAPGIYQDYLHGLPQATQFLGRHYSETNAYEEKAARVCASYKGERKKLVELLLTYNHSLHCSMATEAQIQKLSDPRAVVVICGQQAGLLTGPLYTIYKALATVKLAAKLELELARPVVPVFWVASEDNDFSEANQCFVVDKEQRPAKLTLDLAHQGEPIGHLALTVEAGQSVLSAFAETVPESEFGPELMSWLDEARQSSATPAAWFVRIMTQLFAEAGLVIFDPLLEEARRLAAPLFAHAVQQRQEVQATLAAREEALHQAGYRLQVQREAESTLLMVMAERRTALLFREGQYTTRDGTLSFSESELAKIALTAPDSISPNVLLRPLVQDTLFPTVAVFLGPGETAYFAQALALYPLFSIEPPLLLPRPGVTVIEPRLARYIKRYQLPQAALVTNLADYLDQVIKDSSDVDVDALFNQLRQQLAEEYEQLKSNLVQLNPQLGKLTDKNLQHLYSQVQYLQEKAEAEIKKKNEVTIRHFSALQEALRPFGKPQERVYNVFMYLAKYGPNWWQQLQQEFPAEPGHYLYLP